MLNTGDEKHFFSIVEFLVLKAVYVTVQLYVLCARPRFIPEALGIFDYLQEFKRFVLCNVIDGWKI